MNWSTKLFECCNTKDVGILCCINHTCCGPCVWGDALKAAGVKNANKYATNALIGSILSTSNNGFVSSIGNVTSTFSFTNGRIALAKKYGINESSFDTFFARLCCPLCAQVQEVNTVMEREGLVYDCVSVKPSKVVQEVPKNKTIKRPSMAGNEKNDYLQENKNSS